MNMYENWVGQKVQKKSGKPFKSGSKVNTVKSVIQHPTLNEPAFTFHEDESHVACRWCCFSFDVQ